MELYRQNYWKERSVWPNCNLSSPREIGCHFLAPQHESYLKYRYYSCWRARKMAAYFSERGCNLARPTSPFNNFGCIKLHKYLWCVLKPNANHMVKLISMLTNTFNQHQRRGGIKVTVQNGIVETWWMILAFTKYLKYYEYLKYYDQDFHQGFLHIY